MSYTSTASSLRTLSQYYDARSQLSTPSTIPPPSGPSTPNDKLTTELLADIDKNITATACGTDSLPALLTNLSAYLLAKASDGIPDTPHGRPHLNQQIKYAMLRCRDHARFPDLKIGEEGRHGREGGAPEFGTVWAMLERLVREWKEGAGRMRRLQEGCNLNKMLFWLLNVELDGESCVVKDGGEGEDENLGW